jgi:hypothetical protein
MTIIEVHHYRFACSTSGCEQVSPTAEGVDPQEAAAHLVPHGWWFPLRIRTVPGPGASRVLWDMAAIRCPDCMTHPPEEESESEPEGHLQWGEVELDSPDPDLVHMAAPQGKAKSGKKAKAGPDA